ncbi:hypothetical protein D3C84_609190 [compost metagenome]
MGEGTVDQRIDTSELFQGVCGEALAGFDIGNVRGYTQHLAGMGERQNTLLRLEQPRLVPRPYGNGARTFACGLHGQLDT